MTLCFTVTAPDELVNLNVCHGESQTAISKADMLPSLKYILVWGEKINLMHLLWHYIGFWI